MYFAPAFSQPKKKNGGSTHSAEPLEFGIILLYLFC